MTYVTTDAEIKKAGFYYQSIINKQLEEFLNVTLERKLVQIQEDMRVKPYMNKKEAANYIGVSFNTLQKFIHEGLPVVIIGGIQMIRKEDIDGFMLSNRNI